MRGWEAFRAAIDGLTGDARRDLASRVIAMHQRDLAEDPPDWLLRAAGSRAMSAYESPTRWFEERAASHPDRQEQHERETRPDPARGPGAEQIRAEMRREHAVTLAHRAMQDGLVDEEEAFELAREFADDPQGLREQLFGPQTAETDAAVRGEIARDFELDLADVPPLRREWARDEQRLLGEDPPAADLAERQEIARTFGMPVEEVV